ncbi:DEAD/DEAH box helicase family protein [bacterium]|nr:DEAD/DEAH box helicase family protein [bacterium]
MKFKIQDKVQLVHNPEAVGMIESIGPLHQGVQYYEVFINGTTQRFAEQQLRHDPGIQPPIVNLINGCIDGPLDFQRLITLRRLQRERPLRNNIFAYNASKIKFYPHQFKPLLKFLDSAKNRLLIADEVGLGKTIEAGLIMTELAARGNIDRVLIIVPSYLCIKWQDEMFRRFGQQFDIYKAADLESYIDKYIEYESAADLKAIISLGAIRQPRILEKLATVSLTYDLVIVDEAHHARNRRTNQHQAIFQIAPYAENLLFLTATPIQLGNQNLSTLLRLLDPEEFIDDNSVFARIENNKPIVKAQNALCKIPPNFDGASEGLEEVIRNRLFSKQDRDLASLIKANVQEIAVEEYDKKAYYSRLVEIMGDLGTLNLLGHIYTRTLKRDAVESAKRKARSILVNLSSPEKAFYDSVTNYVRSKHRHISNKGFKSFILHIPQRRMASCIPAMVEYYRRIVNNDDINLEDYAGEDEVRDLWDGDGDHVEKQMLADLKEIVNSWDSSNQDSKYDLLKDALMKRKAEGGNFKVLVFAFFRDTLEYLNKRLQADGFGVTMIHGGVKQNERLERIQLFKENKDIQILLSSRVGSEGLDFQFCDTLVNYDLPWNPMEVEQRIGRLDRIGQSAKKIIIYNLSIANTIEHKILLRLYDRLEIFEESIGMLEEILGEKLHDFEAEVLSYELSEDEQIELAEKKIKQIELEKKNLEIINKEQGKLVGYDEYFNQEVKAIQENKRFVTSDQMRIFLTDFLRTHCKNTLFSYNEKSKIGEIEPRQDLRDYLIQSGYPSIPIAIKQKCRVVFDSQIAYENEKYEFINVLHPLIRTIINVYTKMGGLKSNAHVISLKTDLLTNGTYFYMIYLLDVQGLSPYTILEIVVLSTDGEIALDRSQSEILMAEMVEKGQRHSGQVESVDLNKLFELADMEFLTREHNITERRKDMNRRLVDRRLDSVARHYDRIIEQKRRILDKAIRDNAKPSYQHMINVEMNKAINKKKHSMEELKKNRELGVSNQQLAAGLLTVKG